MNDDRRECPEAWEEADLLAYVEDDLDPEEVDRLERHLQQCDGCAKLVGDLRRIVDVLRHAPEAFHPERGDLYDFVATGKDPDHSISKHLAECRVCAEDAAIFEHMRSIPTVEAEREPLPSKLADEFRRWYGAAGEARHEPSALASLTKLFVYLRSVPVLTLGSAAAAVLVVALAIPIWHSYKAEIAQNQLSQGFVAPEGAAPEVQARQTVRGAGTSVNQREPSQTEAKFPQSQLSLDEPKSDKVREEASLVPRLPAAMPHETRLRQSQLQAPEERSERRALGRNALKEQTAPFIPGDEIFGPASEKEEKTAAMKPAPQQALHETKDVSGATDMLKKAKKPMEGAFPAGVTPANIPNAEEAVNSGSRSKRRPTRSLGASLGYNQPPTGSVPAAPAEGGIRVRLFIVNRGVKDFDPSAYKPPYISPYNVTLKTKDSNNVAAPGERAAAAKTTPRIVIILRKKGQGIDISARFYQTGNSVPKGLHGRNVASENITDEIDKIIRKLLANEPGD